MGLDMCVFAVDASDAIDDFSFKKSKSKKTHTLHTWRKHPNLHGWMEQLWAKKLKAAGKTLPDSDSSAIQFVITNSATGKKSTLTLKDLQSGKLPSGIELKPEEVAQLVNNVLSASASKGEDSSTHFNNVYIRLTESDIGVLGVAIASGTLPSTAGFFFGESTGEEQEDDLIFIAKALDALKAGKHVYYYSWW